MAGKGSAFERKMARELSLWWSDGVDDDLFWRVMGSGGRATRRSRVGKGVKHQSFGDIEATDPDAKQLTDLMVIELKRGYGRWALEDVIDGKVAHTQVWSRFVDQVVEGWRASGRRWWMVIYQRDKRETIVAICPALFTWIAAIPATATRRKALLLKEVPTVFLKNDGDRSCAVMRLADFFRLVPSSIFRGLCDCERKRRD